MRIASLKTYIAIVLLTAFRCLGAPATAPAIDPAIAPFITDTTIGLARLIPSRIDLNAVQTRQEKMIRVSVTPETANALMPQYQEGMSFARQWLSEFKRSGGDVMYCVVFMHLSIGQNNPSPVGAVLVVPLKAGANAKALASLFVNGEVGGPDRRIYGNGNARQNGSQFGVEAVVLNNAVVYGMIDAVEKCRTSKPMPRAALTAAMAAAGDAPL